MAKRSHVKAGEKYLCNYLNGGEIPPGQLLHGGLCNPTGNHIFATCDKRHRICVRGSGEYSLGNLFDLSFLWKIEISPTHCRNLKYDVGQERRLRSTRPSGIIQQKIPKFDILEQRYDCIHHSR